ncbi:DUF6992 family protein [Flectobacillus major]|jgi:hypothetical protein|uniref:DUF6992 family protein n=1 Tax=Flectobacillus major TaxID=103 RepID=UPI0006944867|nr:hypothetical protein [Flectobacillus major]
MKKIILFIIGHIVGSSCYAQLDPHLFNQERLEINRRGMLVLGGWSVGNLATSGILIGQSSGSEKYFYQMNLYWNAVNGALAGLGYLQAKKQIRAGISPNQSLIDEQYGTEKVFLLNTGLDVAYVIGGAYLLEKSKNSSTQKDLLKGYGQSVIMQGSFLMLFDGIMYAVHRSHAKNHVDWLKHIAFDGRQVYITWTF